MKTGDRVVYEKRYEGGSLRNGEYLATYVKAYPSGRHLIAIDGKYGHTECSPDRVRPATTEDEKRLAQGEPRE